MELLLLLLLVLTGILGALTQEIPEDRIIEVCSGSTVRLPFEGANFIPLNFKSWHFRPPGEGQGEVDMSYLNDDTQTMVGVGDYENAGLELIGDRGILIPDVSAADTGQYRFSQDKNFIYSVTVKDPCLNSTNAEPKDGKTCIDVNCFTKETYIRLDIMRGDSIEEVTQVPPYRLCGTSPVNVTCVVEKDDKTRLTAMEPFVLKAVEMQDEGDKETNFDEGDKEPHSDEGDKEPHSEGLGVGVIAAIAVVGGIAFIGIVGVGIWFCKRRSGDSRD